MATTAFTHVKVFSTTKHADREAMGDKVTAWLHAHPELEIVDKDVRQSSDQAYHCVTIILYAVAR